MMYTYTHVYNCIYVYICECVDERHIMYTYTHVYNCISIYTCELDERQNPLGKW